jgi:predicted amidophosphoribosyltransferase
MVLDVKHGDDWVTEQAGGIIAGHLNHWLEAPGPYVFTYVPGTPGRAKLCAPQRLASAIRRNMAPAFSTSVEPLLTMIRRKARQQHDCISPDQRRANVRGCYAFAGRQSDQQSRILLVDDIVTSDATLMECASVLMAAMKQPVIALAMARTVSR